MINMADESVGTTSTIILATVVPIGSVAVAVAVVFGCWWLPRRRRRRLRRLLFRRGITSPVDDEEIASWKTDRSEKKDGGESGLRLDEEPLPPPPPSSTGAPFSKHRHASSGASSRKPPSLIVYQSRLSEDNGMTPTSPPPTTPGRPSIDIPPTTPVLARAPNARPGLTDEAVQGEDAFVSQPRRQPSRLAKAPPGSRLSRHGRSKSSRATIHHEIWYGASRTQQPRRSVDHIMSSSAVMLGPSSTLMKYSPSSPVRSSLDEQILLSQSEIGRAIG